MGGVKSEGEEEGGWSGREGGSGKGGGGSLVHPRYAATVGRARGEEGRAAAAAAGTVLSARGCLGFFLFSFCLTLPVTAI